MTRKWRIRLLCWMGLALVFSLSGCTGSISGGQDAGGDDAGGDDAGGDDAGGNDAGGDDAGWQDAGGDDAGGNDAGGDDAGWQDAGGDDAGGDDAGGADDGGGDEEETYGSESNPTGNPIGGGPGYNENFCPTDLSGDYQVATKADLLYALDHAGSGDVICVKGTANIDISGESSLTIPGRVTLASDRGFSSSRGGRIYRTRSQYIPLATFEVGGPDVRITGLRIEGADSVQEEDLQDDVKAAIMEINKSNLEVDNCEIYNWSYTAIAFENNGPGNWNGHIHHNYIHHCHAKGYGYGTMVAFGNVLIEGNQYDYTRHAVIGEGCEGEKFEFRYNSHGTHAINPVLDLHTTINGDCGQWRAGGVSGQLYRVHHNTITYSGSVTLNAYGTPSEGLYINNNRFEREVQALNGPSHIFMTNNYVGGVFYSQGPIN
jgi:hypothetical protein